MTYPGTGVRLYDWWLERAGDDADEPALGNLGGGSDHVGFHTHAGVPSGGLSSGNPGGVYHSNYDNFAWFERFGDSEFIYGPMVARADRPALRDRDGRPRGPARLGARVRGGD